MCLNQWRYLIISCMNYEGLVCGSNMSLETQVSLFVFFVPQLFFPLAFCFTITKWALQLQMSNPPTTSHGRMTRRGNTIFSLDLLSIQQKSLLQKPLRRVSIMSYGPEVDHMFTSDSGQMGMLLPQLV